MAALTIDSIVSKVTDGSKTARMFLDEAFLKADQSKSYNAIIDLTKERAYKRADEIDDMAKTGQPLGRLAGVPFVVKDNFLAYGAPTTAASKMLADFEAPLQATAVEKLEAQGAICIGKANLDAFAHGASTENSAYGVTKNSVDNSRVAGGSSGGSAVVTALDIVPFALGSDTGGSIRQPASFNGVYGMKPTYGTVSRFGVVAMASSTDTIGCFAKSPKDVGTVMNVMAGLDYQDMTTLDDFMTEPAKLAKKLKIGVIKQSMTDAVDPEVVAATRQYTDNLAKNGHDIEEVSLDILKYTLAMYYIIVPAEVSSNLARYDGVRYGHRASGAKTLAQLYGKSRDEGFVTENKRRIMIGSYVLSSGYYDAYYEHALRARTLLITELDKLFSSYDLLITPTVAGVAFKIGQNVDDPVEMYQSDLLTVPASLAGIPALSVPAGANKAGLPIGVQIMGPKKSDVTLIELAMTQAERDN